MKYSKLLMLAVCGALVLPTIVKADGPLVPLQKKSFQISMDDTFEVVASPGWTMQPGEEMALRYGSVLITGPNDAFSLSLEFFCDTKDLAKFNTPEKMKKFFNGVAAQYFNQSVEKERKIRVLTRPFTPAGRYGYAARFTDKKYENAAPPAKEWKYATVGIFRLSKDSALLFSLYTNTLDDAEYVKLLDYIAAFERPEAGESDWKIADAKQAAQLAAAEFAKRYPAEILLSQQPYSVTRQGNQWLVHGNMWVLAAGGVAEATVNGATGEVLKVIHGK